MLSNIPDFPKGLNIFCEVLLQLESLENKLWQALRKQNPQPLPRAAELLKGPSEAQEVHLSAPDLSRQMAQQRGRFSQHTPCTGTPAAPASQQTHLLFRTVILAGNTQQIILGIRHQDNPAFPP